jgi:plastocyanin
MSGTARGEHVWFRPQGLAVAPGTTLRFLNRDAGNSHTATAYHPDIYGRPRRIPEGAEPWDSGFLLPDEDFEVTLEQPGVYDFYCLPHEMAGMVGRIVVGQPGDLGFEGASQEAGDLPEAALTAFPSVEEILAAGRIDGEGHG